MNLDQVVQNLNIFKNIKGLIKENKLSQSVIFVCEDFSLLDSLIFNVCKEMFSETEKVMAKTHPDVYFYPQTAKKNILVEDVQNIIEQSLIRPIEADKKLFVIKAENLSGAVQNKLLKTLEEPNKNVFYFLLS